jgi:putative ABC transport system permease protein
MQIALNDEVGREEAESFSRELQRNTDIERVSMASNGPFSGGSVVQYNVEGSGWADGLLMSTFYIDDQFIPLLDLDLIAGRNFNPQKASDSLSAFIINEAAAEKFGWLPEKSVGEIIILPQDDEPDLRGEVIGIVNDFHFESLKNTINPLIMRYRPERFDNLLVRTRASDLSAFNKYVGNQWEAFFPGMYFFYFYIESNLSGMYQTEEVIAQMLTMLTWLTIFIACLGLLGLASYTTLQRTKEIGIRKVMGATVREIVAMLSYDFMRYVLIALVIGIPLAWLGVNQWLQNFAYHSEVGITTVVITLVVTIGIALATVSWQSVRAALANPVESLRNE